jgi:hypothetical protein
VRIVYLDQNKWIELARAAKHPAQHPDLQPLLDRVVKEVSACHLALPLTSTNIYETFKIKDPERREYLARLQAALSGGLVFRGRYRRLQAEIADVVRRASGLAPDTREPLWIFF